MTITPKTLHTLTGKTYRVEGKIITIKSAIITPNNKVRLYTKEKDYLYPNLHYFNVLFWNKAVEVKQTIIIKKGFNPILNQLKIKAA